MTVITRFAPSPTGFLHIGGARTALFNYLYAKHHGGRFLLRIEDTDRARSTQEAVDALLDGLSWLGLDWDGEPVYQFSNAERHRTVAEQLLAEGKAYRCYCTPEELEAMRTESRASGRVIRSPWRHKDPAEAPEGTLPTIRLKAPEDDAVVIDDAIQGQVTVKAEQLDDMVILRSDGTPVYMLAVVVDDHDMGITHIIRGDDHLTNAARQIMLYDAMGWDVPSFAHVPLIHGPDGAKLSKRHGALGAEAYREMGYLPEAMCNYLLRLGWSHGDDEIITREQATQWFDLPQIGKSPARFDMGKLDHVNGHYIREAEDARLVSLVTPRVEERLGRSLSDHDVSLFNQAMNSLKQRVKNLNELADNSLFYFKQRPIQLDEHAAKLLDDAGRAAIAGAAAILEGMDEFTHDPMLAALSAYSEEEGVKLGKIMQPIRAAITGSTQSPSMFEVMEQLGKEETLARLKDACTT